MKKVWNSPFLKAVVFLWQTSVTWSQNVGISPTGVAPHPSAGLDVNFSDKGMLTPRVHLMGTNDVATIPNPARGLVVYNINATMTGGNGRGFYFFDSTASNCCWRYLPAPNNGPGNNGQVLVSRGATNTPQWFPLITEIPSGNNDFKICIGKSNAWQDCNGSNGCSYNTGVLVDINISGCGFTQTPYVFTSISGTSSHWMTTGVTSIYLLSPTGFRVYVHGYLYSGNGLNTTTASNYQYTLMWMAIGR